jgi:protein phosphatase
MEKDAATLYCPNELCQAANPLTHNYCQRCSTPLPKRYLWLVAEGKGLDVSSEILADRYLVLSQFVIFDTKPAFPPQVIELEKLQEIRPYLRLFPYRLHVPQVYGIVNLGEGEKQKEFLLLEKPPIYIDGEPTEVKLYESLDSAWGQATSMRQLNWLWQIAQLWQPLASEGVASTLLDKSLMRVEGSLVRLLSLRIDPVDAPSLVDLGEFWLTLQHKTKSPIAEFVGQVCDLLVSGEIHSGEQLVTVLDQGLVELGRAVNSGTTFGSNHSVKIVTRTDTGPSRQRNEDACYPASGSTVSKPPQPTGLAIVCDGIGGHEGGNVASNIAIEVIQQQVQQLAVVPRDRIDPGILLADLERAAAAANDKICQRNDSESRQGRQRMGTTLVMGLPIAHEMYITHVGDSRAYLITRQGCYQVTLDDDVASREVRLGYAIYRDAVQQGASGSLVQALGMAASNLLHPTAQRFILDEDCVFLLCSDGLSDFDRVEQCWDTEILPILTEDADMGSVADRLVEIANTQNGHDNVTVAIVHCQIKYAEPEAIPTLNIADLSVFGDDKGNYINRTVSINPTPSQRTQVIPDTAPAKPVKIPLHLVALLFLVAVGGVLGYMLRQNYLPSLSNSKPITTPVLPTVKQTEAVSQISKGSQINTKNPIEYSKNSSSLNNEGTIPPETTLLVLEKLEPLSGTTNPSNVLHMRVCSIAKHLEEAPAVSQQPTSLKSGEEIWIQESQLKNNVSISRPLGQTNSCSSKSNDAIAPVEQSSINTPRPTNSVKPKTR